MIPPFPTHHAPALEPAVPSLCRDCLGTFDDPAASRCPACGGPRVVHHPELFALSIAHLDCDAFYAAVEKRENPALMDKPLIIGGTGRRGVVSTACYLARLKGVRSAMPMFQARRLCPEAVILPPRPGLYADVSRKMREMMEALTPLVEPLALDEAFLDLTGTERLHHAPPAVALARLARDLEERLGITASIGLAPNKFLAKLASDMDKPRGFTVIGREEAPDVLADMPVSRLWGVGAMLHARLLAAGIRTVADLRRWSEAELERRFGATGGRLWNLAHGHDPRPVSPSRPVKSISREVTLPEDIADPELIRAHLDRLAHEVADRARAKGFGGRIVTLKLKRRDHRSLTRRLSLSSPTALAERIFRAASGLVPPLLAEGPFRLIGVGISDLTPIDEADPTDDLVDAELARMKALEKDAEVLKRKYGATVLLKGRQLRLQKQSDKRSIGGDTEGRED